MRISRKICAAAVLVLSGRTSGAAVITIAPLGDSIVAGYDGANMPGYRQYLLNDLTSKAIPIQYQGVYDPTPEGALGSSSAMTAIGQNYITAFGGFTSADILANLAGDVPSPGLPTTYPFTTNHGGYWFTGGNSTGRQPLDPDIVLLQIGTNDPITAYGVTITPAQTEQNITGILDWFAVNRPSTTVLISSPPPAIPSGPGYVQQIADATPIENQWLQSNITPAQFPNARYVDVYDMFLNADGTADAGDLGGDGVHPTVAGYQIIANAYDAGLTSFIANPVPALVSGRYQINGFLPSTTVISVSGTGSDTFVANGAGGILARTVASINLAGSGQLSVCNSTTAGSRTVLVTSGLSLAGTAGQWQGRLDLGDNDMIVEGGSLQNVTNQILQGYNGGQWNGSGGIVSTSAANDTTHLTALGAIQNNQGGNPIYSGGNPFDGATPATNSILVKYTYYGDTNLDGKIDGSDYSRIDAAYLADKNNATAVTGWFNGDFNYDGFINGSDYTLIDNAFNSQGAVIQSLIANPEATTTSEISAVPEPAISGILSLTALTLLPSRRRRAVKTSN